MQVKVIIPEEKLLQIVGTQHIDKSLYISMYLFFGLEK